MTERPASVLIIGSGPVIIGQAAEFDYAGTQACRALREEGVRTILLNSNPATIMTDPDVADAVYLEPLTLTTLEGILERERPEGVLAGLGGQTALNLAMDAGRAGLFERYGTRLLGTPIEAIEMAEDRERFRDLLDSIGQPYAPSFIVEGATADERQAAAERALEEIGLPAVIRPAFTLGGTGGGIVDDRASYDERVRSGLRLSPIGQVMVERCLVGWQEIEYEVMRDAADTCIAVCSMENVDPLGVHTGDSVVVAPVQTLPDPVHQRLRSAALDIIRALGVEGGCNVQFALSPDATDYAVIEVNPRVSRSSALASKATGYPIARVAAQIAIGRRLEEIPNAITKTTVAAFEPALDYIVVKLPRFPFDKFPGADRRLGSQMKATGEVMAIDRTFGAALNKALRGLEQAGAGFLAEDPSWEPTLDILAGWAAGSRGGERSGHPRRRARAGGPRRRGVRRAGRARLRGWRARDGSVASDPPEAFPPAVRLAPVAPPRAPAAWRPGRRAPAGDRDLALVPVRDGAARDARAPAEDRRTRDVRSASHRRQARLVQRPRHRDAHGARRGRGRRTPPLDGPSAGLRDGGHVRGRVRGRDAVLLRDLRRRWLGTRGGARLPAGSARHRLGPRAHRPGHRVRLLRGPGRGHASRGRRRGRHDQLEPRDGLHGLRRLDAPLLRAARRGERAGGHRGGDGGR